MSARVIVIGGGIAGLTAAFRLQERGVAVTVLERDSRVGGRMRTIRRDGYQLDAGANILFGSYRQMLSLIAELGLTDQVAWTPALLGWTQPGGVRRVRTDRISRLIWFRGLSVRSRLAAIRLIINARRHSEELDWCDASQTPGLDHLTAAEYSRPLLTAELADYVDTACYLNFFAPATKTNGTDALFGLRNWYGYSFFNSPAGIDFLPRKLATLVTVELSARATHVEPAPHGVLVTWERPGEPEHVEGADAVVIAVPGNLVPGIYEGFTPEQRAFLGQVTYSPMIVPQFGLASPPAEPAVYVGVLPGRHRDLVGICFDHNKAASRAPAGHGLITTHWREDWVRRQSDTDDKDVIADAISAVEQLYPAIAADITVTHLTRWASATVRRPPGTYRLQRTFLSSLSPSVIQLAGDYFAPSCTNTALCSGELAARRILDTLKIRTARVEGARLP